MGQGGLSLPFHKYVLSLGQSFFEHNFFGMKEKGGIISLLLYTYHVINLDVVSYTDLGCIFNRFGKKKYESLTNLQNIWITKMYLLEFQILHTALRQKFK